MTSHNRSSAIGNAVDELKGMIMVQTPAVKVLASDLDRLVAPGGGSKQAMITVWFDGLFGGIALVAPMPTPKLQGCSSPSRVLRVN